MSYVQSVLQPGETVTHRGALHWVVHLRGLLCFAAAAALLLLPMQDGGMRGTVRLVAAALALLGAALVIRAAYHQWITEIAVTDRRVIYKRGLVRRTTAEMHIDKVESVAVNQSILGRMLDYGTIDMRGTGGGIEDVRNVAAPIAFRNAITAR